MLDLDSSNLGLWLMIAIGLAVVAFLAFAITYSNRMWQDRSRPLAVKAPRPIAGRSPVNLYERPRTRS